MHIPYLYYKLYILYTIYYILYIYNIVCTLPITYTEIRWRPPVYHRKSIYFIISINGAVVVYILQNLYT